MTILWIILGILYVACWIYFGLATFRKGHYWMFWIGFFLPILWIIGAFLAPTDRAAARFAGDHWVTAIASELGLAVPVRPIASAEVRGCVDPHPK